MLLAEDSGAFFSATLRPTTGFFGGEGVADLVDIFDLTEAIDGERFAIPGLNFPDSGVAGGGSEALEMDDAGRFVLAVVELIEAVDGTLGLEIVILPVDGPCVLLLLLDIVEAVDVRLPASELALLNVVDASLAVDMEDVGRDAPAGGGRRLKDPPLRFRPVGVLERMEDVTDGADDLGLG